MTLENLLTKIILMNSYNMLKVEESGGREDFNKLFKKLNLKKMKEKISDRLRKNL